MSHIFVFTAGNPEARQHLTESIENPVSEETVFGSFASTYRAKLNRIKREGDGFYAWGAIPGARNLPTWEAMERDDYVLCVSDNSYRYVARVIAKHENRQFAQAVWGESEAGKTWQYMYFLTKPIKIDVPLVELVDYLNIRYMGFTKIPDKKLDLILDEYGSVEHFVYREFEVHANDADSMDPPSALLLEADYGAYDSVEMELEELPPPQMRNRESQQLEPLTIPIDYPLPLAHSYALAEVELETFRMLKQLYRSAEGLTVFLASLALALAPGPPRKPRDALLNAWGGKGATFGNWYSILARITSRIDEQNGPLYHSMKNLLGTTQEPSPFVDNIRWLIDRRNDLHHRGTPAGRKAERLVKEVKTRYLRCVYACSDIWQHPLRLVLDFDGIRDSEEIVVTYLDYSSHHFVVPKVQERHRGILQKQDLYILQSGELWISLYPFISVHYCPHCDSRETYFVDAWQGPGEEASLQSFELAHEETSPELGEALASWLP